MCMLSLLIDQIEERYIRILSLIDMSITDIEVLIPIEQDESIG